MTIEGSSGKEIDPEMTFEKARQNQALTWADMDALRQEILAENISEDLALIISELIRANKRYRNALEFYASFENYVWQNDEFSPAIEGDCGDIAREALK